ARARNERSARPARSRIRKSSSAARSGGRGVEDGLVTLAGSGADARRAHASLVETRGPVALDEGRSVRADGDIPTDVWNGRQLARGAVKESHDLVPHRNLEVDDRLARLGV